MKAFVCQLKLARRNAARPVDPLVDFMATHSELELEVSNTDRRVDLVQEGFDCALRLGPIGDETLIARPLGKLRMLNAASPRCAARQQRTNLRSRLSSHLRSSLPVAEHLIPGFNPSAT